MTVKRMDNVGIVVDDLPATVAFFSELGLELEGGGVVEGVGWACDRPRRSARGDRHDAHARRPQPPRAARASSSRLSSRTICTRPVNALGYLRVMFAVDDIDETLRRVLEHGAELVSTEVVQYEESYRLCYVRGPGGLLIGLAQELG